MAKVTITVEDVEDTVDLKMTFEPEIVKGERPTPSQSIAVHMLELLKDLMEAIDDNRN